MSKENEVLALRSNRGIKFCHGPPLEGENNELPREEHPNCRDMVFSKEGSLFAWCTSQRAAVTKPSSNKICFKIDDTQITALDISPKGSFLATWQPYATSNQNAPNPNLHIYRISSGECIKSFIQKKQTGWKPQWSDDEFLCARNVSNEVHFFENANFGTIAKKIFMQKIAYFSLAPGSPPYHIACYVPGVKGGPSFVRLFRYPNFEGSSNIIAQKSFFKAERTDFYWNKSGKDCIILTSVDVDKSGASYYGELNLYYVSVKGDTAKVSLGKDGPVYSVQWHANNTEFCVVYGYMPAKAGLFNLKCEPVFDFGSGPRNECHYSPVGNRLILCGFGNLQGMIEVWDLEQKKQISKFQARDSTCIEWSNDGEYVLTATTSPRLRIGNGYRIWHYTGSLLQEIFCPINEEVYDIRWKPQPEGKFLAKPTTYLPVAGIKSSVPEVSKQVYRPPAAQGKPSTFKLHDQESNAAAQNAANTGLTKNQKKNLAKKAKKQSDNLPAPTVIAPEQGQDATTRLQPEGKNSTELTGDPEKDKKIRSLLKKLDQIEKLKKDQSAGKQLELNQLEKIKKEHELLEELSKLQIS